jgi:transposase
LVDYGTLTLAIGPEENCCFFYEFFPGTMDQFAFVGFIIKLISNNFLKQNDILVCDNWGGHNGGADSAKILFEIIDFFNISLVFLPCYSPELNPVENVFGWLKHSIRQKRISSNIKNEIIRFLSELNLKKDVLKNFFVNCKKI